MPKAWISAEKIKEVAAPPPATTPTAETAAQNQEAEEEEPATVEIPPEKQQLIGVKLAEATVVPLKKTIRTAGRIEYDERRLATVNTKFEGWVERLPVNYTGQYVKKGAPLAEIYSPELLATQQELLNALRWVRQEEGRTDTRLKELLTRDASSVVEAARQRLRLWDISDKQIRQIEETGRTVRTLTLYSPVSGYVIEKPVLQGMRVMPGDKLFDIADLSSVWVIADIYEYEIPLMKNGQTARISLSYLPGKEFSSRIDYIYPTLSAETRTGKVRFSIANPQGLLKPQMFTTVEISLDLGKRLVVPEEAVMDTGVRKIVYVDKGEGYFEPREVSTGVSADGMTEVIKGIKAGEKVARSANFLIDAEARLKGVVH
ncbi:MAG: efflux RND transporter periplasmic adaptor subunit [Nitrospirales bacterium]|nr:efflux RND transporter periplasmic adaptor subunit [Nitrospirales bacterium]